MIREYTEEDIESTIAIWYGASTLAHPFLDSDLVQKIKKDMREIYLPNSKTWVFEENYKVVGFIGMIGNEIGGLFVAPEHHSKGIGTKLVNFVAAFNDDLEVEVFEKNFIGRSFYEKYGFRLMKEFFHEQTGQPVLRLNFKKNKTYQTNRRRFLF